MALPAWKAWVADAEAEPWRIEDTTSFEQVAPLGLAESPARAPRARVRSIGDRRIIAEGLEHSFWTDFYYNAMTVSWPAFFGVARGGVSSRSTPLSRSSICIGDAPIANARPGSFADLFFFSVETTSTVGYGDMHPQTMFGHLVATIENFVGLVLLAVMTGLVFARFSRPRARLIFARNPVITNHNGVPTLTFRVANARNSFISEATAKLWMLGPTDRPPRAGASSASSR